MTLKRAALALTAGLTLVLAGAGAHAQDGLASLRIAHMSPDAPLVDALIGRDGHLRDMGFGEVSPYLALPAGEYEIQVYPHRLPLQREAEPPPAGADASNEAEAEEAAEAQEAEAPDVSLTLEPVTIIVTLEPGSYYTVVLSGFYEPPIEQGRLGALRLDLTPDDAQLLLSGPRGYRASLRGDQQLPNLEPGAYTIAAGQEGYQTARYEVELQPDTTTVLSISLQRAEGEEETPEAATQETAQPSQWQNVELHVFRDELAAFPAAGQSQVRLIHTSPVTPALDALARQAEPQDPADEEQEEEDPAEEGQGEQAQAEEVEAAAAVTLAEGLGYPNNSDYLAVPSAAYGLELRAAGTESLLAELPLSLEPGASYTLFLVGDPADSYPSVIVKVDALVTP